MKPAGLEIDPSKLDFELEEGKLTHRLDCYESGLILTKYEGNEISKRHVHGQQLLNIFRQSLDTNTPLLPEGTVHFRNTRDGPIYTIWVRPQVWPVTVVLGALSAPESLRVPLPGLLFTCMGSRPPQIFAALERPKTGDDAIYRAPLLNCFENGTSCPGNHVFPSQPDKIPQSFFESRFTPHQGTGMLSSHEDSILKLWRELDGKRKFPKESLRYHGTFNQTYN